MQEYPLNKGQIGLRPRHILPGLELCLSFGDGCFVAALGNGKLAWPGLLCTMISLACAPGIAISQAQATQFGRLDEQLQG